MIQSSGPVEPNAGRIRPGILKHPPRRMWQRRRPRNPPDQWKLIIGASINGQRCVVFHIQCDTSPSSPPPLTPPAPPAPPLWIISKRDYHLHQKKWKSNGKRSRGMQYPIRVVCNLIQPHSSTSASSASSSTVFFIQQWSTKNVAIQSSSIQWKPTCSSFHW